MIRRLARPLSLARVFTRANRTDLNSRELTHCSWASKEGANDFLARKSLKTYQFSQT